MVMSWGRNIYTVDEFWKTRFQVFFSFSFFFYFEFEILFFVELFVNFSEIYRSRSKNYK